MNKPTPAGEGKPRGELTVQIVAMPRDTNANGDIFGGWVVSQMDIACGITAVDTAKGRVVTVAIDAITFIRPVKVGDVLCVYTALERVGRASMTIHVRPGSGASARARRKRPPMRRSPSWRSTTRGARGRFCRQDVKALS
jgi:acyl-CoA thioesterase YciA